MSPPPREDATPGDGWGKPLAQLLADWPAVATDEGALPAAPPPVPPEEASQIAGSVLRRQIEYATARLFARRAAARLGVAPFILRNDADRSPRWPHGLVGSLTHTGGAPGGYCAAAVARPDGQLRSVGVDAEMARPLPLHLWRFVLTSSEQIELAAGDPERQGLHAKVVFSAKECFYKAQYPLTRLRLGFHDVEVALDIVAMNFEIICGGTAPAALSHTLSHCRGRFGIGAGLITTAMVIST